MNSGLGTVDKRVDPISRALQNERVRAEKIITDEIEQAKEFGPHHIPILSAVRTTIRKDTP